jgi:hypothetical protein
MREALRHYARAEYGPCLSYLQPGSALRRDLEIDLHLQSHVPTLLDMIRDRCIVQYFQPYSSVSLEKMGCVFGCSVKEMEEVVSKLIRSGGMDGMKKLGGRVRIDAYAKTLSIEDSSVAERRERRRARVMAAKMGVQFKRNAEGMLMSENFVPLAVIIGIVDSFTSARHSIVIISVCTSRTHSKEWHASAMEYLRRTKPPAGTRAAAAEEAETLVVGTGLTAWVWMISSNPMRALVMKWMSTIISSIRMNIE